MKNISLDRALNDPVCLVRGKWKKNFNEFDLKKGRSGAERFLINFLYSFNLHLLFIKIL